MIINGILAVIHSFGSQDFGGFIFRLLLGVITVIFGGLILSNILVATIALTVLLAAFLLVEGIFNLHYSYLFIENTFLKQI